MFSEEIWQIYPHAEGLASFQIYLNQIVVYI